MYYAKPGTVSAYARGQGKVGLQAAYKAQQERLAADNPKPLSPKAFERLTGQLRRVTLDQARALHDIAADIKARLEKATQKIRKAPKAGRSTVAA